ncbi:hypothetical protein GLOIN_2v1763925, partial [Rhizophagus irregularis DAOM 181602=DAOM 197198]
MSLSDLLNSWTTKKNVVVVLIQMRQFIFNEIFEEVWIPRCSHLKEFERSLGLTKKKKLKFKRVRSLPNNNSSNNNIIHYDSLDRSILLSSAGRASTYQVLASVWEVVGAKVSFLDKEKFDQFLKMEIVIQEQKEGDSGVVFNVKLQPTPLKTEKVPTTNDKNSDMSQNSNSSTIQVIDIPAYRQVREIRESFEDLGEIEKIYTRGAGLYQVAFITYKDANSIDYFNEQWSYHINKDIVRVLPLLLSKEEREKRKQFSLRLSGLHYQTSGYDLKEVMTQCKGKTCFIPAVMIRGKYQ